MLRHSPLHTSELLLGSHGGVDQVIHLMVLQLFYPDQTLLQVDQLPSDEWSEDHQLGEPATQRV